MDLYFYKGIVTRHYDGDTPTIAIDMGFNLAFTSRVRMAGINAPEITSKDPAVYAKAIQALQTLQGLIPIGMQVIVQTHILDNYGRVLGTIWQSQKSTTSVNDLMLQSGLVVPMLIEKQIQLINQGKKI